MSYPNIDEAVKEISKRHGVPEEKVWEKIEDKIEPEAEDESGRAKLGKILKMGGALGLAATLGFSVNEMARASPDSGREVITGRGMGTANNPFPQSHFESISTEQASISKKLKIGILGDSHYNEETGTPGQDEDDMPTPSECKDNWDVFIDYMNDTYQPDVVVSLGDLINGGSAPDYPDPGDTTTAQSWLQTAVDYLTKNGGTDGTGLDAPVEWIVGNHEWAYMGPDDMNAYSSEWSTLSDLWRVKEYKNVELFLLLNSGDSSGNKSSPIYPTAELDWLEDRLGQNKKPKLVFQHLPTADLTSDSYNNPVNRNRAMQIIQEEPTVIAVIFGHVHNHDRTASNTRYATGFRHYAYGTGNYFITGPHNFEHDKTVHPFGMLDMDCDFMNLPYTGKLKANYSSNTYRTYWRLHSFESHLHNYHEWPWYLGKPEDQSFYISHNPAQNAVYLAPDTSLDYATFSFAGSGSAEVQIEPNVAELGGSQKINSSEVKTSDYTTSWGDYLIQVDTSSNPVTITLASAMAETGVALIVKDYGGNAGTNNITVATEGTETIDGATSKTIATDYGKLRVYCPQTNWMTW